MGKIMFARPTGNWADADVPTMDWAGYIISHRDILDLCLEYGPEGGHVVGTSPHILGTALLASYWALDANIEDWWAKHLPRSCEAAEEDQWWDYSSDGAIPVDLQWIYLGSPRGLNVMVQTMGQWFAMFIPWSESVSRGQWTKLDTPVDRA